MTTTPQVLTLPWQPVHRRRHSGAAGAPAVMASGEIAGNDADTGGLTLYWGAGDDGSGNATSKVPFAGPGAFVDRASAQTVAGIKTFSASPLVPTAPTTANDGTAASMAAVRSVLGYVTPQMFNPLAGGPTQNSTAAIQAAHDYLATIGGGEVYFPAGEYIISAPINVSSSYITFRGANHGSSRLFAANLTVNALNVSGNEFRMHDLGIVYNGVATAGSALYLTGSDCRLDNFRIVGAYNALEITTGSGNLYTNFSIFNFANIGIYIHGCTDHYFSVFVINAGGNASTNGAGGCIRLMDECEAVTMTCGAVLFGAFGLSADASDANSQDRAMPQFCKFSQVYFDTSYYNGLLLSHATSMEFVNCWFGFSGQATKASGVLLGNTDSITFVGCDANSCGAHGYQVTANAVRTVFTGGCKAESNGTTIGPGNGFGFYFAPGTHDFTVTDSIAHNGLITFGQQAIGIKVDTGASDRYTILGNLVSGNVSGGVLDGGTGTNKLVMGNW